MIRFFLMLVIGYCVLAVFLFVFQDKLIFLPEVGGRELVGSPADIGLPYRAVSISTTDGETLHAWWVEHPSPRARVLFSHGNAGNISHRLGTLRLLYDLRASVLLYDYRGYGQSTGRPDEQGFYVDGDSALAWLDEQGTNGSAPVVLMGRSMGAAVAAYLAAKHQVAGLVIESGFTSVPDLAQEIYWWLPARWLARIKLPTLEFVSGSSQPTLVIHSPDDEIVPFEHGLRLFEAAPQPSDFVELAGSHNTGFFESEETYVTGLDRFFLKLR